MLLKCSYCGCQIDSPESGLKWNKQWYHEHCLYSKWTTRKRAPLSQKEADDALTRLKRELQIKKVNAAERERFFSWLMETYQLTVLPRYFFVKVDSIVKGSYQGLARGIPISDLFEMWQMKIGSLDKMAAEKKKKGVELDKVSRIHYDLAVLLNRYDRYLAWKEKQRIAQAQPANDKTPAIRYIDMGLGEVQGPINDISDLLDEI